MEKNIANYKAERKANWKTFKHKMDEDIGKIKRSLAELFAANEHTGVNKRSVPK